MSNNTKVYFISSDYIKENTPIIDDVENTLITSHILEAQNIDLQYCIGSDLYDDYVNKLSGFTTGDSIETLLGTDYFDLFDNYFKPFLVYQSVYYSFYDLYAKITAKGVVNQTSGNSNTAELRIMENMRKEYKIKSEYYKDQMVKYLSENWTKYPLYVSGCGDCDTNNSYVSGLYTGSVDW